MSKIVTMILLFMALAGMASCAEPAGNNTTECVGCDSNSTNVTGTDTSKITYTFLQEGTSGNFVKDNYGNYTLTIVDVVPYTIYFSDRPARMAGFAPMDKFLSGFCFDKSNPPNAAIWLKEGEDDSNMIIVELTSPNYDMANKTLIYTAKILDNYAFESNWSSDLIQTETSDAAIPEKFGRVGLVIDSCKDGSVSCCNRFVTNCCGNIDNVGCCWSYSGLRCNVCHDYTSECTSKYGSDCSNPSDNCAAWAPAPSPSHKGGEPLKDKSKEKPLVSEKANEIKYPYKPPTTS